MGHNVMLNVAAFAVQVCVIVFAAAVTSTRATMANAATMAAVSRC